VARGWLVKITSHELPATQTMTNLQTLDKLKNAGIVVALPGDLPLAAILPIADALLASPILAVDVAFGGDELPQLLHDLRQRAGR
jgi:hypothetical protein